MGKAAQLQRELQSRQDVLPFEILVVGQNLVGRHPGAQQLENRFNRITQAAGRGLPVADFGIDDDAIEKTHPHTTKVSARYHSRSTPPDSPSGPRMLHFPKLKEEAMSFRTKLLLIPATLLLTASL